VFVQLEKLHADNIFDSGNTSMDITDKCNQITENKCWKQNMNHKICKKPKIHGEC